MDTARNIPISFLNNPLFAGLSSAETTGIFTESHKVSGIKNQELFETGDPANSFFYVMDGWIKLYRINREGEETIIHIVAPGETFAEAAVFGSHHKYPVNAQFVEDGTLLAIPRAAFVERIGKNPDLALQMLGTISARQRYLIQQIEQLTIKDAPQRIGTFLLRLCQPDTMGGAVVNLPYDKSLISRRLNIQPETFSRGIKKLESYGVSTDGRCMVIRSIDALAEFCEVEDRTTLC